jgi:hypothetical protein
MRAFRTLPQLPQSPQQHEGVLNFWYPKIRTLCKFLVTSTHVRWAQPKLSSKQSLDCRQCFLQRNHNTCSEFGTSVAIFHYCDAAHVRLLTQPIKHHHKHQGLDPLIRSVSRVTVALSNVSSVFQLFSMLVVCSGMISRGFGFVAFFASVKASLVCIHLSCLGCIPNKHSFKIPVTTKRREEITLECSKTNSSRLGRSYLYSLGTERCWFICIASQHNTRSKPPSTMQYSTTYSLRNTHRTSPRTVYSMRRL